MVSAGEWAAEQGRSERMAPEMAIELPVPGATAIADVTYIPGGEVQELRMLTEIERR